MAIDERRQRSVRSRMSIALAATATAVALAAAASVTAFAAEPALASQWIAEETSRTRIIAGGADDPEGGRGVYAGLEIALDDGWKTYWRNPGSSGVPPRVDWEGSENLAKAELLFPAPRRFADRDGDTIGYKKSVVLPIRVTPKDPSKPVKLKLAAEFGICREICIPVQPALSLELPPDAAALAPGGKLTDALARVPRRDAKAPGTPRVERLAVDLAAPKPRIVIEASFPGDASEGDVFLEAPDGIWIPLPKAAGTTPGGHRRFEVDLTDGADIADLRSRTILMTLVGGAGQMETAFKLE